MTDSTRVVRFGARHTFTLFLLAAILSLAAFAVAPQGAFAQGGEGGGQQEQPDDGESDADAGDLDDAANAVEDLIDDGAVFVEVLCGVGLMFGLGMLGLGQRAGMSIVMFSVFAGLLFLLGDGAINLFWKEGEGE